MMWYNTVNIDQEKKCMAQEYICINSNKENGIVALNSNVFETIAIISCEDLKGILLADDKPFNKAVTCKVIANKLTINMNVLMKQGVNFVKQCDDLQLNVKRNVETMTGLSSCIVNVEVVGYAAQEIRSLRSFFIKKGQ